MKRRFRLLAWTAAALLVVPVVLGSLAIMRHGVTRPTVYELPSGYRGWLQIYYEDATCPPNPTRGVYQVMRVGTDGRGCTSGSMPRGWHYQRAEYIGPNGERAAAPSVWPLGHSETRKAVIVFVGGEDEFRSSPHPVLR